MEPKRMLESVKRDRKGKRRRKDKRIDMIIDQMNLVDPDDDADIRVDIEEFITVLDNITQQFQKVRGSRYPEFEKIRELTNMEIFSGKIHPIAKYLNGGMTIHDLFAMHSLNPGRRFYFFNETDSMRLSLFWSYGATSATAAALPMPKPSPSQISVVDKKLQNFALPPPVLKQEILKPASPQATALAMDAKQVFKRELSFMKDWPLEDTSDASWKYLLRFIKRSSAIFKLYEAAYAKKHPGQTVLCGPLRDELLEGMHSKWRKECHVFMPLYWASESAITDLLDENASLKKNKMSTGYTEMRQGASTKLDDWIKKQREFPPRFQEFLNHFPIFKGKLKNRHKNINF
jgi:hypothetical protein